MGSGLFRIGIADDHIIVRAAFRQFLEEQDGVRVVGEASDGRAAIDLVRKVNMDVLILDIAMPGQSGVDAIAMLRAKAPQVRILVLSTFPADSYGMKMIRLGASGYLNKQCEPEEVLAASRPLPPATTTSPPNWPTCWPKWASLSAGCRMRC